MKFSKYIGNSILLLYLLTFLPLVALSFSRAEPFWFFYENMDSQQMLLTVAAFLFIFAFYVALFLKPQFLQNTKSTVLLKRVFPLLLLLAITPPLMSRDILAYVIPVRNSVEFKQPMYTTRLVEFTENPWHQYILDPKSGEPIWKGYSIYGPPFNIFMSLLFWTGLKSPLIYVNILIYKIFALIFYCGNILLIYALLKKFTPEKRNFITNMAMLNPSLIIHHVLDSHNDVLVIFLALLSLFLLGKNLVRKSYIAALLSVGIKHISILMLPIYWAEEGKLKVRNIVKTIALVIITYGIGGMIYRDYFYFMSNSNIPLIYVTKCIYTCLPTTTLLNTVGGNYTLLLKLVLFGISSVLLVKRFLIDSYKQYEYLAWIFTTFILLMVDWVTPWYITYIIVFVFLTGKNTKTWWGTLYALTAYSMFHYFGI